MTKYAGIEKRRYVRLDSVFPVEFQFIDQNNLPLSGLQQGFTKDVSEGGLCLEANCLSQDFSSKLLYRDSKLLLNINIPLSLKPVMAIAKIAWHQPDAHIPDKFRIGVSYEEIDRAQQLRIVKHARFLYYTPKVVLALFLAVAIGFGMVLIYNVHLRDTNKKLAQELALIQSQRKEFENQLSQINQVKDELSRKIDEGDIKVSLLEADLASVRSAYSRFMGTKSEVIKTTTPEEIETLKEERKRLEDELKATLSEKEKLGQKVSELTKNQGSIQAKIAGFTKATDKLKQATIENMYSWVKVHQNKTIGLISSYEGDDTLKDVAFTYDQALTAINFVLFKDYDNAKKILDFYHARVNQAPNRIFANAYDSASGGVFESVYHAGPNIWLAIAVLRYTDVTGDTSYMEIALGIADWVMQLQGEDTQGAVKGSNDVSWVSTEHNLDAYAMFDMLYKVTRQVMFKDARDKIFKWLKENAYSKSEYRMYRGKGDSTIATDTLAWAIAAIGPVTLKENGMDPDAILKFAEENCLVNVKFMRPNGQEVKVSGFDFAKAANIARGGIVSSEWTAQMIVSFKMMADFYIIQNDAVKAKFYFDKVEFYLNELQKLIITSPSWTGQGQWCLPYATIAEADTGHGWRTPKGNSTGSVSGTVYAIFAEKGFNPLKLKKD